MDSIVYINELINYATRDNNTFELNIESDTRIKHNIFDGTIQTQEFVDFIWDLYYNYANELYEKQLESFLDKFEYEEGLVSYPGLFKEFQELCKPVAQTSTYWSDHPERI